MPVCFFNLKSCGLSCILISFKDPRKVVDFSAFSDFFFNWMLEQHGEPQPPYMLNPIFNIFISLVFYSRILISFFFMWFLSHLSLILLVRHCSRTVNSLDIVFSSSLNIVEIADFNFFIVSPTTQLFQRQSQLTFFFLPRTETIHSSFLAYLVFFFNQILK